MDLVERIDRQFYPDARSNWDDDLFRKYLLPRISGGSVVLDLGAGRGLVRQMNVRDHAKRVCGIDTDPRVLENPFLDEGRIADAASIPYQDCTFDLVFANNVLEHIADPRSVFAEIYRALRPGGTFLFKTPNRRHYVPTIARLTPHRFHEWVNSLRGRQTADTHPTLYRVNTARDVRWYAEAAGLEVVSLDHVEGRPEYLRLNAVTYMAGLVYERLVNRMESFASLRVLLIGELRKPLANA